MKRLIKAYEFGFTSPVPILVKDIQDKIENDEINDITYGPNISREYLFEKDLDNAGWALQQTGGVNKVEKNNWIKSFILALNDEKEVTSDIDVEDTLVEDTEEDVTAEINVKDLPSIIWNDEEYRVLFNDDGTAEILNNFGNHITTLDATTIDEVNEQLGDQQIVAIKDKIKELKKLANEISEDLLSIKPDYARYDGFDEEEFDAKLLDFNNMIDSINLTQKQIELDNSIDRTTRKEKYYADRIKLNDDDVKDFQEFVCPCCGEETLELIDNSTDEWKVYCNNCKSNYIINSENGDVFLAECELGDEK